ncbi:flavin adenine dinucleotide transporter [Martiniozyma asiatica (nom. inval.)]|nr:flavin adenine dinucleotide transporter [Martiniozyma asiatica]
MVDTPSYSRTAEAVAGFTAGLTTTLVAHPLDFIKLRMQLDTTSRSQWQAIKSVFTNVKDISRSSNGKLQIKNFTHNIYRGLGPNIIGSTTAWGMYFTFYRQYKNIILNYSGWDNDQKLNSLHYLGAAFAAGWSTSIITNPIWVIKTRMISTDRFQPGAYSSIWDGIKQIYKNEGIKGYYRGLTPALVNVAQGAVQLSIYDTFKHYMLKNKNKNRKPNSRLTTFQNLYMSAISKMIATGIFYPLQVVRARLQVAKKDTRIITLLQSIIRQEGLGALYKGISANLARVVPATCLTFVVYEEIKALWR